MLVAASADGDDEAEDASASFTLTAPGTRRSEAVKADNDDANADSAEADVGKEEAEEEPQTAVSASYTIVSRREKPVEQMEPKEPEAEQTIKTDSDEANQRTRPTELSLAPAESKQTQAATTPATSATTPGAVESPVRLRDKRSLSSSIGGGGDADAKSETASPVAAHADFNARDSLLSLYARGAGVAAPAPAATSASSSAAERRPSWRLKFDAGSKVKHTFLQQEQSTIT